MRGLVNKTMDELIDLSFLREVKNRGDTLKLKAGSLLGRIFWRILFPITTATTVGWVSYLFPESIPPGNLIVPEPTIPPTGGNPIPPDPLQILQASLLNGAIYGIGALVLVGILLYLRRR